MQLRSSLFWVVHTAFVGGSLPMFRDDLSVPFLGSKSQRRMGRLDLKNGTLIRYSVTSVNKYQIELHKKSKGRRSQQDIFSKQN